MSKDLVIPDYLKAYMIEQPADASGLIATSSSVPRISLKSSKFRFIIDSEEIEVVNDFIYVVILGVQPEKGMAKTYYADGYVSGSTAPPDCSSFDGVHPDSWVSNPQSNMCAKCPQNAWGSAISANSGKKIKACRDSKRLMVVKPNKLDGTIFVFNVTVSSLKAMSTFGQELNKKRLPMASVITKIIMDPNSEFPMVSFEIAGILNAELGPKALKRSTAKEWTEAQPSKPAIEHKQDSTSGLTAPKPVAGDVQTQQSMTSQSTIPQETNVEKPVEPQSDIDVLLDWSDNG